MIILANALSLQMLDLTKENTLKSVPMTTQEVKDALSTNNWESAIGHEDTANVLSSLLDTAIQMNRKSITLDTNTTLIVAQVVGGRLPADSTRLPDGVQIVWVRINLI